MRAIDKVALRFIAIALAQLWFFFRSGKETFVEMFIYPKDIDQPEFAFKKIRVRIDFGEDDNE